MSAESHEILVTAVAALSGGILLLVLAHRFHVPAIVLLLLGGVAGGSQGLGIIHTESLGDGLLVLVELSVGLILFEGGLTLQLDGYRSAPKMIKRLLTVGVLTTWLVSALLIWLIVGVPWEQAVITASLIIVTGPTVIAPLLKRIRVTKRLHSILKWEAVLIDPIGVFVAVLCFEWLGEHQTGSAALINLGLRTGVGLGLGLLGGALILALVKRRFVPDDLINIFTLAGAVLIFGLAEMVISKAGLLAVTVAGFTFGFGSREELRDVRRFKAELTDLLIATLFMLLAARLELEQFGDFGIRGALAVIAVMFLVRPFCIFLCSIGVDVSLRERAFLSWIAPRGIVAASMASLFALSLEERGVDQARFVETFTYSVIVGTIVLQGLTAGPVARLLKVQRPEPRGWLIVGAHAFAQQVAGFLRESTDATVVLVDTSGSVVQEAAGRGFQAIRGDARDVDLADKHQIIDVGHVLALTDNEDLNARICEEWSDVVGREQVYRWRSGSHPSIQTERMATGHAIWSSLPRPSALSSEIARGTTTVIRTDEGDTPPPGAIPLLLDDGKNIRLLFDDFEDADPMPRGLWVRRDTDALRRSTRADRVLLVDQVRPPEVLLEEMLQCLAASSSNLDAAEILPALLERERRFPSVIGKGVAVPHAYSSRVRRQFCAIACLREPMDYLLEGEDAEQVNLVFLLISPRANPKAHLALLADIAHLVGNDEVRESMLAATTADEVIEVIRNRQVRN